MEAHNKLKNCDIIYKLKNYDITFLFIFVSLLFGQLIYIRNFIGPDEAYYLFKAESILSGSLNQRDSWVVGGYPAFYGILSLVLFIFGDSIIYPRIILFIINGLNAVLIFKIGSFLFDEKVGKVACILFLIGVLIPTFQMYMVLTEPFMLFFGLIGIYYFLKSDDTFHLVLSGFLFSISSLCKTIGLFYIASIGLFFILNLHDPQNRNKSYIISSIKKMSLITFGFIIPAFIGYLYFHHIDSVSTYFIFQAMKFIYVLEEEPVDITGLLKIFISYAAIWVLSLVAIFILGYKYIRSNYNEKILFIAILFIISLYPLTSRQYGHYFIPVLPHACILASILIINTFPKFRLKSVKETFLKRDYIQIFTITCIIGMVTSSFVYDLYLANTTVHNGRIIYKEQIDTSNYIISHTLDNDSIFVFTYQPSIYYLSGRKPVANIIIFDKFRHSEKLENEIINKLKNGNIYVITQGQYSKPSYFSNVSMFINNTYKLETSIGIYNIYTKN